MVNAMFTKLTSMTNDINRKADELNKQMKDDNDLLQAKKPFVKIPPSTEKAK